MLPLSLFAKQTIEWKEFNQPLRRFDEKRLPENEDTRPAKRGNLGMMLQFAVWKLQTPLQAGSIANAYMKTLKALVVFLVAAVVILAIVVYSGTFDVAADTPHSRVVYGLLEEVRDRSISVRSGTVQVPPLTDPKMIAEGAEHYAEMCTGCHLAPGVRDSEIRPGLYPQPPDLTRSPPPSPARAFWVVKHGIKLTAMPAWGTTHSDPAIWDIVAFLQKLPTLTPEQYRALSGDKADTDHGGEEAHHDHTEDADTEPAVHH